jgi:hypothetical protein
MTPDEEHKLRGLALRVIWQYYGAWYTWGADAAGSDSSTDCSGLVQQPLKAIGSLPRGTDETAEALRSRYRVVGEHEAMPGDLVFWLNGSQTAAVHVEMIVERVGIRLFSLGASGGGPHVVDLASAKKADAWVKVRPVESRGGVRTYASPY